MSTGKKILLIVGFILYTVLIGYASILMYVLGGF